MVRGYLRRQLRQQQKHHHHLQKLQQMQSWTHGSCGSRSKCSHRQEGASCQRKLQLQLPSHHLRKRQQLQQRSRCDGSCHSCHRSSHARTHGCSCCRTHGRSHLQAITIPSALNVQHSQESQHKAGMTDRYTLLCKLHMAACLSCHDAHDSIREIVKKDCEERL